jgi:hypothetical protein
MTTKQQLIELHDRNIRAYVQKIIRQLGDWRPDYVVGITRGGLIPAVMISQYLDVPMHTLNISFRDGEGGPESNLWMAEDAFGYVDYEGDVLPAPLDRIVSSPALRKNILIVDDINDSGRTLNWIKQDWPSGCLPHAPAWDNIWHNNVRFAVIVNNEASEFKDVDYAGTHINKLENPCWVVFPWENWWEN